MTLTEFLLARIAEDEAAARACDDQIWSYRPGASAIVDGSITTVVYDEGSPTNEQAEHIAHHDPARVLAQCAAYKAIVAAHELSAYYGLDRYGRWLPREGEPKFWYCDCESDDGMIGRDGPCTTLRALATIWADHPDYREQWT